MTLADIQARARAKAGLSTARARASYTVAADKARKAANLKAAGYVVPLSAWLGHNKGPAWDGDIFIAYCWEKSHKKAWTPPNWEIGVRRARRAAALGLGYRQYVLEIMERGFYLNEDTAVALKVQ